MKRETKLNFLAIIMGSIGVALISVTFTPIGGVLVLLMFGLVIPNLKEE